MLKSNLDAYTDPYTLVKGTITVTGDGVDDVAKQENESSKDVIFKNFAPFREYTTEINNTQIDNTKDIDAVIPMHNFMEHTDIYANNIWEFMEIPRR